MYVYKMKSNTFSSVLANRKNNHNYFYGLQFSWSRTTEINHENFKYPKRRKKYKDNKIARLKRKSSSD